MSKGNGKGPIVQLTIIANTETGETNIEHPEDVLLALRLLNAGIKGLVDKMVESRARVTERLSQRIQTAGASSLRVLPRNGE